MLSKRLRSEFVIKLLIVYFVFTVTIFPRPDKGDDGFDKYFYGTILMK